MPAPRDDKLLRMDGWPGGINNRIRETEQSVVRDERKIPSSQFLRKALNVDLTAEGHPLRRRGQTLLTSAATTGYMHSLFTSDLLQVVAMVAGGLLIVTDRVEDLLSPYISLAVNAYLPMAYVVVNDSIYFTNGEVTGEIHPMSRSLHPWGVPIPPQPVVTGPSSDNPGGWDDLRQISVTYVDALGREGGASEPVVTGSEGTSIVTIPMPLPPGVVKAQIYASQPGGEILYHTGSTAATSQISVYQSSIGTGKELDSLNLKPPKPGQLLTHMNGRIYTARNDTIYFTEALRYHVIRPSQGIYMFPFNVTMMESCIDGVYVGHKGGVVFIGGRDPYDVTQTHVSPYAPVPGAVTRVPGEKFGVEIDEVPVWWGTDGVMVLGLPGGQLRSLTRDRLAAPKFGAGAVSLREREGMSHIVSSLSSSDGVNNMGATDTVVASVRTHNIVLNS